MYTHLRKKLRHYSKRAYTLIHALNDGFWSPKLEEASAEITTPGLMNLENTRRNFQSELPVTRDMFSQLRSDDVVWDIGAGYGTEACLLAQRATHVVAIDTDPIRSRYIEINSKRNGLENVIAVETLVGEGTEKDSLTGSELAKRYVTPDVVCIDVEGGERSVLESLETTLSDIREIYIEVHPSMLSEHDQVTTDLQEAGFEVEQIHERGSQYFIRGSCQ